MFIVSRRLFWPFSNNSGLFQDFRRVRKISESCRRFPKAVEDVWRLPKMSEHCRRCPKTAEDVHWDCQRCPQTYDRRYLKTTAELACITHKSSILKALLQRGYTKMKFNINECLNLTSNECNNRIFLLPIRSAILLRMYNGQQKWQACHSILAKNIWIYSIPE